MDHNIDFKYPKQLKIFLSTLLAKYSSDENLSICKDIIQNAEANLELGIEYDNWNHGIYYHKLILNIPFHIFSLMGGREQNYEKLILNDINNIAKTPNEQISIVSILVNDSNKSIEKSDIDESMWKNGFRIFISHKVEDKLKAKELKNDLADYGISAFVAHEDIKPNKKWLSTIENALLSMDAFVALITDGYCEKIWTNQEIGFAYCLNKTKGIPFVSIRAGDDPKGFISPIQFLSSSSKKLGKELCNLWLNTPKMTDSLILAMKNSPSFNNSSNLFDMVKNIKALTENQIKNLMIAFNENSQMNKCFKINGEEGSGIVNFLNEKSRKYVFYKNTKGLIQAKEKK